MCVLEAVSLSVVICCDFLLEFTLCDGKAYCTLSTARWARAV